MNVCLKARDSDAHRLTLILDRRSISPEFTHEGDMRSKHQAGVNIATQLFSLGPITNQHNMQAHSSTDELIGGAQQRELVLHGIKAADGPHHNRVVVYTEALSHRGTYLGIRLKPVRVHAVGNHLDSLCRNAKLLAVVMTQLR